MTEEKKKVVLGVRLSEDQYKRIRQYAKEKYSTASTIGRVLVELLLRGQIEL